MNEDVILDSSSIHDSEPPCDFEIGSGVTPTAIDSPIGDYSPSAPEVNDRIKTF